MASRVKISIKGTQYYDARALFSAGDLKAGVAVELIPEPDNPYDKNAVSVREGRSGRKLGHLPRQSAAKYVGLLKAKSVTSAKIVSIAKVGELIGIEIEIVYQNEAIGRIQSASQFGQSISGIASGSGIYAIKNTRNAKQYIGSSADVRKRLLKHLADLEYGNHANGELNKDFSFMGPDNFQAVVLKRVSGAQELLAAERDCIERVRSDGVALYNRTVDGRGTTPSRQLEHQMASSYRFGISSSAQGVGGRQRKLQDFNRLTVAELKSIRTKLVHYLEAVAEADRENEAISQSNRRVYEENAESERREREYVARSIQPVKDRLIELERQIAAEKIGSISSLWTSYVVFSPSRALVEGGGKVKDTPRNRQLLSAHEELLEKLRIAETSAPAVRRLSSQSSKSYPKANVTVTISGKETSVDFLKLNLSDLDELIAERS